MYISVGVRLINLDSANKIKVEVEVRVAGKSRYFAVPRSIIVN